jgi:hypothetical protein
MPDGSEFPYLKVSYNFHVNPDGWQLQLLDEGDYYNQTGGSSTIKPFQDSQGNAVQGILDGSGHSARTQEGGSGLPTFLTFNAYKSQAFAPLNLPQNFNSNVQ